MSTPIPPPTYKLTLADVIRFFSAKGISGTCPQCMRDGTYIQGFGPNETTAALTYSEHPTMVVGYMHQLPPGFAKPVVTVDCLNCGHMRIFNYSVIYGWAVENPAQPSLPEVFGGQDP